MHKINTRSQRHRNDLPNYYDSTALQTLHSFEAEPKKNCVQFPKEPFSGMLTIFCSYKIN